MTQVKHPQKGQRPGSSKTASSEVHQSMQMHYARVITTIPLPHPLSFVIQKLLCRSSAQLNCSRAAAGWGYNYHPPVQCMRRVLASLLATSAHSNVAARMKLTHHHTTSRQLSHSATHAHPVAAAAAHLLRAHRVSAAAAAPLRVRQQQFAHLNQQRSARCASSLNGGGSTEEQQPVSAAIVALAC